MRDVARLPVLLVVVALLVAGGLADRSRRGGDEAERLDTFAMPVAAPADALSSAWYCAGGTADGNGFADGSVIVANPAERRMQGSVTLIANDAKVQPVVVPLDLAPWSRSVVVYREHLQAPFVAALVQIQGGEVVAEHSVSGPTGADVAPCAAAGSDHWYFADGGTVKGAVEILTLFNPFPDDALVDVSLSTEQGRRDPPKLQGVFVPRRGLTAVNIGDASGGRFAAISMSVNVRAGRVVADRIQSYDGTGGRKGLALVLGAPSPGTSWWFPDGFASSVLVERFQLYNPNDREAKVSVSLALERGQAEPFELTVPAHGRITLRANDEGRIPKDVAHAATIRSENGVGVVAERSFDAIKPGRRSLGREGLASTMGSRLATNDWVFAAGLVSRTLDEWLVVQNPGDSAATVSVLALASGQPLPIEGMQCFTLAAGKRTAIRLGDHTNRADLALHVHSSAPVVAERGLYRVGQVGISSVIGIPLRSSPGPAPPCGPAAPASR